MFIAHLPASYLLGRSLRSRFGIHGARWAEYLGGVLPDFDLAYFYLVDHQRTLHHHYWTHLPCFWVALASLWAALASAARSERLRDVGWLLVPSALLHLVLDTAVGRIEWLAPFSRRSFALFDVPARYHPYMLNFVLHWTFAFELSIVGVATGVWLLRERSASASMGATTASTRLEPRPPGAP